MGDGPFKLSKTIMQGTRLTKSTYGLTRYDTKRWNHDSDEILQGRVLEMNFHHVLMQLGTFTFCNYESRDDEEVR